MGKLWVLFILPCLLVQAADIAVPNQLVPAERIAAPAIEIASGEAERIMKRFRIPNGFKVELVAAEPMLANPVAFAIDEKGRFYVSETHRYRSSALDIRHYMSWLEDDLASRTVQDRENMVRKWLGSGASQLAVETEIIRFLEDRDGDGRVDFTAVFADNFNSTNDGIASGVLPRNGQVYFANIPNLWLLSGPDSSGRATSRRVLSSGYGVHFSLTGHDLHGLKFGPDGKLYFTVGDRGAVVRTAEGTLLNYPDEGVCFRSNPDGSELEVFARGLRNPQELAFDDYGNLFTGDNDSDQGDIERWVYILEGSDTGWRIGYQHHPLGNGGPWNAERLWIPYFRGQPAYVTPPLANIGNGPSGIVYYPGTGLPADYKGSFFVCYFKGTSASSAIDTIRVEPSGGGYKVTATNQFVGEVLPTDVDFGYDGAIYFTDWNQGWEKSKKGRIYRVYHPGSRSSDDVAKVKSRFAEGFRNLSPDDLIELFKSPDQRVRLEAQFNLAEKIFGQVGGTGFSETGQGILQKLHGVARQNSHQLSRIHALWTISQVGRRYHDQLRPLLELTKDPDAEIRAQVIRIIGDSVYSTGVSNALAALSDSSARVQYFAAMTLGKLRSRQAFVPIREFIRRNNPDDVFLRHAGAMALAGVADASAISTLATDRSPQVRMAAVLALRKLESPAVSTFLSDIDPQIALEAARAINDVPIITALPALAAHQSAAALQNPWFALRIANANYRVGIPENALRLADIVTNSSAAAESRVEALYGLATWGAPFQRDRIVGTYRPLPARSPAPATNAFASVNLLQLTPAEVQLAAIKTAAALNYTPVLTQIIAVATNIGATVPVRQTALLSLEKMQSEFTEAAALFLRGDTNDILRAEANRILNTIRPNYAVTNIAAILESGTILEKQVALRTLGTLIGSPSAERLLSTWLNRLVTGAIAQELALDILEAAGTSTSQTVSNQLATYLATRPASDVIAKYRVALAGGNSAAGHEVFYKRADVSCLRCHKVKNEGGDVGPALDGIATRQTKEYLLESIVQPNRHIAPGYESVLLSTKQGISYAGLVKNENASDLVLNSPEDGLVTIKKTDITSRDRTLSSMPEGIGEILSLREMRDLLAFLYTLK